MGFGTVYCTILPAGVVICAWHWVLSIANIAASAAVDFIFELIFLLFDGTNPELSSILTANVKRPHICFRHIVQLHFVQVTAGREGHIKKWKRVYVEAKAMRAAGIVGDKRSGIANRLLRGLFDKRIFHFVQRLVQAWGHFLLKPCFVIKWSSILSHTIVSASKKNATHHGTNDFFIHRLLFMLKITNLNNTQKENTELQEWSSKLDQLLHIRISNRQRISFDEPLFIGRHYGPILY